MAVYRYLDYELELCPNDAKASDKGFQLLKEDLGPPLWCNVSQKTTLSFLSKEKFKASWMDSVNLNKAILLHNGGPWNSMMNQFPNILKFIGINFTSPPTPTIPTASAIISPDRSTISTTPHLYNLWQKNVFCDIELSIQGPKIPSPQNYSCRRFSILEACLDYAHEIRGGRGRLLWLL
jgi:hypothetical protein